MYPDLVGARRLARAAREGRLLDSRRRPRGAIGLGTEFDAIREWTPEDDVRHINWAATQRLGRPMTNQYRLEQAREVVFLLDTGRLMAAPLPGGSRLDLAMDALTAVGLAADELGDHCGAIAFDSSVRAELRPRRGGGREIVTTLFDLQPRLQDSDYEQAFRRVAGQRRAHVLLFCDLFDEGAARALIGAVPVLARRHALIVASVADPELSEILEAAETDPRRRFEAAVASELLADRARAAAELRRHGAWVVEAPPSRFAAACVGAYLRAKSRLRL